MKATVGEINVAAADRVKVDAKLAASTITRGRSAQAITKIGKS